MFFRFAKNTTRAAREKNLAAEDHVQMAISVKIFQVQRRHSVDRSDSEHWFMRTGTRITNKIRSYGWPAQSPSQSPDAAGLL